MDESAGKGVYRLTEFAKICGTTRDTLIWYDKLGLLKPDYTTQGGYRMYSLSKAREYDMINVLRMSGNSLEEIKSLLGDKALLASAELFYSKAEDIEQKIAELEAVGRLARRIGDCMETARSSRAGTPELVDVERGLIYYTPTKWEHSYFKGFRKDFSHLSTHLLAGMHNPCLMRYPVGNVVSSQAFMQGDYLDTAIFYDAQAEVPGHTMVRKAGKYVQIFHKNNPIFIRDTIRIAVDFIRDNHLSVTGDILEYDLVTFLSPTGEDGYVIQFLIPVE